MSMPSLDRRRFAASLGLGAAALACGSTMPRAATLTKIRVGYLHVLSVDAQLMLGTHLGTWQKEGLEVEAREFTTGVELFQGLIGGGLDVLTTGGVLSNFPARGQGKVFLLNDLEFAVGQIWVHPDQGIHSLQDLKGKKIATTRGTTAHDLLYHALKSVGLDATKDVEIVNQRMSDAVTTFIAGAVPAVALWVPFDASIKAKSKTAKMLVDASGFPAATIVDGWAARNDFHANQKDVLKRFIRAWVPANDFIINKPKEALQILHEKYYPSLSMADVEEMYNAARWHSSADWAKYFKDGSAVKWLNQVTQFNVDVGAIEKPIMADKYFDPSLYLDAVASLSSK